MISETIVVAILALIGSLFGSMMSGNKTTGIIQTKIENLEKEVAKHNNLISRMYKCESDLQTAFVKIDEINSRLDR